MTFVKGQSGNPGGRSYGPTLTKALRTEGARTIDGVSRRARVAAKVYELCEGGNVEAIKFLAERLDGKVAETINQNVTGRTEHSIAEDTLAAIFARYAGTRRLPAGEE